MKKLLIACLLMGFLASGCATVYPGWYQRVPVTSEPAGATVVVDGVGTYTTPAKLNLQRKRDLRAEVYERWV